MTETKYCPPRREPKPGKNNNSDSDGLNMPEIILPPPTNATDVIPDEVPRRDGPGGE